MSDRVVAVEDETETFYTPPSSVTSDAADLEEFDCPDEGTLVFLDGWVISPEIQLVTSLSISLDLANIYVIIILL